MMARNDEDTSNESLAKAIQPIAPKVYDDALSPAAKRVGETLLGVTDAALKPLDGVVWTLNRAYLWLAETVTRKREREGKSIEVLTTPHPDVTSRALLGLQTAGPSNDHTARCLFAGLVANAMTPETVQAVHPAFCEVLRQLIPDECRVVSLLAKESIQICSSVATYRPFSREESCFDREDEFSHEIFPLAEALGVSTQESCNLHVSDLRRLGVVEISNLAKAVSFSLETKSLLRRHKEALQAHARDNKWKIDGNDFEAVYKHMVVRLTGWGRAFATACDAASLYDPDKGFVIPDWAIESSKETDGHE